MTDDTTPIYYFEGDYRFLSNFWPCPILFESMKFPSVEHAFQAAKTTDRMERTRIAGLASAGAAKRAGRRLVLRAGWDDIKIDVMRLLLQEKFQTPELALKLEETGDRELIEGNHWGDNFWGMIVSNGYHGYNHLGRLLMEVRQSNRHQWKEMDEWLSSQQT
jgi:ribA/ribD-fused uncharacterized protein